MMHKLKVKGYSIFEYDQLLPFERDVIFALLLEDQEAEKPNNNGKQRFTADDLG